MALEARKSFIGCRASHRAKERPHEASHEAPKAMGEPVRARARGSCLQEWAFDVKRGREQCRLNFGTQKKHKHFAPVAAQSGFQNQILFRICSQWQDAAPLKQR